MIMYVLRIIRIIEILFWNELFKFEKLIVSYKKRLN